jgi:hypothetical protein
MATRHQQEGRLRRGHSVKGAIRPVCEPTPSACWERIHIRTRPEGRRLNPTSSRPVCPAMTTFTAKGPLRLALGAALVLCGLAAGLVAASTLGPGAAAAPAEAPVLSPEEVQMAAHLDPEDRARYLLQRKIEERAELAATLSQLQELRHQTAMDVIDNIR